MTKITLHCLSQLQPRPEHATDHTGKRRGKLTAIAWCRSSRSGKGAVWVCRCDCGLFEYRRPGTWASRVSPDDMCDTCLRAKGPNARDTASQRLQRWVDSLRDLGLTDSEIARIQIPGMMVETRGRTLFEIREQLAEKPA
ncbi:hypothetical protein V2K65_10265 [Pseudomonas alliivorans]|nr:hypothetical protein [Pseudomonas alliivorans]MEE5083899.1 hypothetical protein [Pseudomonas alliivorans]MEE5097580.1 hypothetical protein [Pseudomonas alliivorans]MEE5164835.1 hypothetical protein [Pseudomonas alliivorans]